MISMTRDEGGRMALAGGYVMRRAILCACVALVSLTGCKAKSDEVQGAAKAAETSKPGLTPTEQAGMDLAPAPEKTGGFDGKLAFQHVAKQVGFGPRPSGSAAIKQTQEYILAQLKSFGCATEVDDFSADTPVGRLAMKNIVAKIPGEQASIIMLATHYDTVLRNDITFVGADDGGSSTGVMLEMARLLCPTRGKNAVWIVFFDGEEAMKEWSDTDSLYGSRQMAAKLAASGDISKIKAFLLADLVGSRELHFMRDPTTKSLTDLVWKTAGRLGYAENFVEQSAGMLDDHNSFAKRKVPVVDVIDLDRGGDVIFWHTAEDTLDKISGKSLAITGHVFLESVRELQK